MNIITWFRENRLLIYYGFLLLVAFVLMNPSRGQIPISIRFVYLALSFAPIVFRPSLLPPTLILFCGLSKYSFMSVLPETDIYYLFITLAMTINRQNIPYRTIRYLFYFIFFVIVSLLYQEYDEQYILWGFIVILASSFITNDEDIQTCWMAFVLLSLFLSLEFLTHMDTFISQYGRESDELSRFGWINPNTFGAVVSAGGLMCILYPMEHLTFGRAKLLKYTCIVTLGLCFLTLVFNASRGAFLSFAISSCFAIILSKKSVGTKLSFAGAILIFIIWMLNNNFFDLLIARMQEENLETGNHRTEIWALKLNYFGQFDSYYKYLIGIGRQACTDLGRHISTHNDFLTALVGFGVVGFSLFSYLIVYPLLKANRMTLIAICSTTILIVIECCVLEPFFRGNLVIIMLYFFILSYALMNNKPIVEETDEFLIEEDLS